MADIAAGGTRANVSENRNNTKDGRVLHCRWFNSYIPLEDGFEIVSLVDDVSDLFTTRADALANEERFRSLFDYSPDPMYAITLDGIVTRANAAAARTLGYDITEMVGRHGRDFTIAEDEARSWSAFVRATGGEAVTIELTGRRADGTTFPSLATMIPIVFRGTITGVHIIVRDLTAMRRAERDVAVQSERLRELYLVAAAANATAESQIAATIDAGCRLLGLTAGSLYDAEADRSIATVGEPVPRRLARLALATDGALAIENLRGVPYLGEADLGEDCPGAYIGTAIDVGGARYGSLSFAGELPREEPFTASDRDLVQLMGALVGSAIERGRSRTRLKHLAYNDQLTALPNRAWFTERLRDELALATQAGTRVGVMFLDLDRFKDINDTLGHPLGDRLLRMIGDRLAAVVGSDGLVARMGGDEFIVLIGNDPATERLDALAQRVIATIDQPLLIDGYEQFVTTSVGIAVHPADGDDADTLIKHADVAMYRAKERGRNTHQFFTPALGASLRTRISQEKSLRKALEREEFVVHYQPQFELAHGRLVSLEALVRWQHPRLGLVLARPVHPQRRGERADRGPGRLGARDRLPPGRRLAEPGSRAAPGGQPLGAPVPPDRADRQDPRRPGPHRAAPRAARARDHRVGRDERRRALGPDPAGARPGGDPARGRRLRHRLLVAGLPAPLPAQLPQDRPVVRARHHGRARRRDHRADGHRHGAQPGAGGLRRGRRDPGAARVPRRTCTATGSRASSSPGRCRRRRWRPS